MKTGLEDLTLYYCDDFYNMEEVKVNESVKYLKSKIVSWREFNPDNPECTPEEHSSVLIITHGKYIHSCIYEKDDNSETKVFKERLGLHEDTYLHTVTHWCYESDLIKTIKKGS